MSKKVAIWTWPLWLATVTLVGLVLGLFSDGGLGDTAGDMLLAAPVVVVLWFGWLRRALRRSSDDAQLAGQRASSRFLTAWMLLRSP